MSIYNRKYSLSLPWSIFICTILFLIPFVIISLTKTEKTFFADEGPLYVFAVGLVPGLSVALAQFILSWVEFSQISKFSSMKIKDVFDGRDSEQYYAKVISTAKRKIDVQGVTASRFVEDFADDTSSSEDKKILISALKNDVIVRFLVPDPVLLEAVNQRKSATTAEIVRDLMRRFPGRIELRYFSHSPTVSIVRADDDFIFGPVFKHLPSRNTPTIHTAAHSPLAQCYMAEFDLDWAASSPLV